MNENVRNPRMYEDGLGSRDCGVGGNYNRFHTGGGEGGRRASSALRPMFTIGSKGQGNMAPSNEDRRW